LQGENSLGGAVPLPDPVDISVYKLLLKIVVALVDRPEFVVIKTQVTEDGATFTVRAHPDDTGKLIGKQGRNAQSLRIIVSGAGRKLRRRYVIAIHEETVETGR
jgi:predicted RNA-binding protein YlqC (UPF0109 family)